MPGLLASLNDPAPRALAGLVLAVTFAIVAYRSRALTASGAVAAAATGGTIVACGGWWLGGLLVLFFVTSSGLSHLSDHRFGPSPQAHGKRRDAVQVLANGGVATVFAITSLLPSIREAILVAAMCAIAAATADTWATEIGRFSPSRPRLIVTGRLVQPGQSGAISLIGTMAAVAGALLIAGVAIFGASSGMGAVSLFAIVAIGGFVGALADSLLGATVQQQRWCPTCRSITERNPHRCGAATLHRSGWRWLDNDTVNAASIAMAAALGFLAVSIVA